MISSAVVAGTTLYNMIRLIEIRSGLKSRIIDGEKEAHLMALACCDALDGRSRRTLRLFGQHRVLYYQPCVTNYPSNCNKLKPYPAAISINPGEPEKEKAAFLSKSGKRGVPIK